MDINATLIGQMITFALFVWFTMKFVWPVLEVVLKARQEKIAEGLLAAERGHKELELAQKYAVQQIHEAKEKATEIIEQAKKQAALMFEEVKAAAEREREQIISLGYSEVEQEKHRARQQLQNEIVDLTLISTQKLLGRVVTEVDQRNLLAEIKTLKTSKGT